MSTVLAFSSSTTATAADIAPPTNVNCSVNLLGAQCSASITSTGSSLTNALSKIEWYVSILSPGALPTDVASYGPLIFVKSTDSGVGIGAGVSIGAGVNLGTGSIDLSYETLLGLAKNDPQGTVLISARTFNSANEATPFFGQRSYLVLSEVKSLMAAEAKAIADKVAADKVAASNKEMNETFIALTNNLNKYKRDITQMFKDYPLYFNQTPELRSSLQRAIDYKIPTEASRSGIDAIQDLIGGGSGSALASDFLLAQAGITKYVALEIKKAKTAKKTTITCVKGKVSKKVSAVNPKCPTGYKKAA
jgi:hypothetical protein